MEKLAHLRVSDAKAIEDYLQPLLYVEWASTSEPFLAFCEISPLRVR